MIGSFFIIKFPGSKISFGKDVRLNGNKKRMTACLGSELKIQTFTPYAEVYIGNRVELNGTSITCRTKKIQIGDGTMIAPGCIIMDSDFHGIEIDQRQLPCPELDKDVTIGNNVWIGTNSIILKGTVIGDNTVVGAHSLVSGKLEPNSIYSTSSKRLIRKLESDK